MAFWQQVTCVAGRTFLLSLHLASSSLAVYTSCVFKHPPADILIMGAAPGPSRLVIAVTALATHHLMHPGQSTWMI